MDPFDKHVALSRRQFFNGAAAGLGGAALLSLLNQDNARAAGLPGLPHFPAKAKRCIFLYMNGGPSQLDLYTPKPTLNDLNGMSPPDELLDGKRFAFIDKSTVKLMGTTRQFSQHGQSGMWFSDLLPNLAQHADKLCKVQTVQTTQFNHHPAQLVSLTGHNLIGHPTLGAWLNYGLGTENDNLPGYVVLNSAVSLTGGQSLWQSAFLPAIHRGVLFQSSGNPILNLNLPPGFTSQLERRGLDALAKLNQEREAQILDTEIGARVDNYELAFRMQAEAPDLVDLSDESPATLERYGVNRPDQTGLQSTFRTPPGGVYGRYARHCLLARRMIERGVRFVTVFTGSWDHHDTLNDELTYLTGCVDQPISALLSDLEERGLLDETLVIIGAEFGRTPLGENRNGSTNVTGRDHHPDAYTILMAGGGVKPGLTYGETDDIGWSIAENPVHISDLHATILKLFGIDHMQLGAEHKGVKQRLTPLTRESTVVDALLA